MLLPLISFGLLFQTLRRSRLGADPRAAFLLAALCWGVIAAALSEGLSLFYMLTWPALAASWGLTALVTACLALRQKKADAELANPQLRRPSALAMLLSAPIVLVALLTGVAALAGWPNEWDSMAYHLGRVLHWAQNQSVAHYPTNIGRQLLNPPWSGFAILHLTLLGGDERAANLVEWFSMLGSVLGVSLIAQQLGAGTRGQLFSALFCALLPMGILQASSTQNDYVTAFWLVCLVYALLVRRAQPHSSAPALVAGASLGLAFLTKTTADVFAMPLLLLFWWPVRLREWASYFKQSALVALVVLALNAPHLLRNFEIFGSPFAPTLKNESGEANSSLGITNDAYTPAILVSNLVRNTALHLGTQSPDVNEAVGSAILRLHGWLQLDVNDPRSSLNDSGRGFDVRAPVPLEDRAGNPLHLVLICVSLLALVGLALRGAWSRQRPVLLCAAAVVLSYVLFSVLFKWQAYGSHLQLPLFVLAAPFVGVVFQRHAALMVVATLAMTALAWPFLMENRLRPLVGSQSVFKMDRLDQYFRQRPYLEAGYDGAAKFVRSSGCSQIGLALDWDDWEYPLWSLLPRVREAKVRFEHVAIRYDFLRQLADRWPTFTPCAVITVQDEPLETLDVDGRPFRRAWANTRVSKVVEVLVADEQGPPR